MQVETSMKETGRTISVTVMVSCTGSQQMKDTPVTGKITSRAVSEHTSG